MAINHVAPTLLRHHPRGDGTAVAVANR